MAEIGLDLANMHTSLVEADRHYRRLNSIATSPCRALALEIARPSSIDDSPHFVGYRDLLVNLDVPDSALHTSPKLWDRFYKTGDLGFYNSDGTIHCSGREDFQA